MQEKDESRLLVGDVIALDDTKIELAKKMLVALRSLNEARVRVAMNRWFLCKKFLRWLMDNDFDWVTKAKRNTVLFRKMYDHRLGKEIFVKLNPQ